VRTSGPDVFHAIADPKRRQILDLLRSGERPVGELVPYLGVSMGAVSQHLRVLREAGLVKQRRDGRHRRYRVDPAPLRQVVDWTEPFARFWKGRLRRLGAYLDGER
jgi:DNA-binding transcriptional ArsR family regulator